MKDLVSENYGKNQKKLTRLQFAVIDWYLKNGRKFIWRKAKLNEWQWLVLEILLRKTKAEDVNEMYVEIISKYPSPKEIISAKTEALELDLKPLGLQKQRCQAFKLIAENILTVHKGKVPLEFQDLVRIPHVGLYTANALLCFCKGERRAIVDVNVVRLLCRINSIARPKSARRKWIWGIAESLLPETSWREYNFGLLDIGGIFCKNKNPDCGACPVNNYCIVAGLEFETEEP